MTVTEIRRAPTVNFVVKYTAKETDKKLTGTVSHTLTRSARLSLQSAVVKSVRRLSGGELEFI